MQDTIFTNNPMQESDFFDFHLITLGDQCIKAEYKSEDKAITLDPCIGAGILRIQDKYLKLKEKKKLFDEKQEHYKEEKAQREAKRKQLSDHIIRTEQKNTEYKNTILAFGKLYSSK